MKLSSESISILKNFSLLQTSVLFREGNIQRAISTARNVFVEAEFEEVFPMECAIFELPKFLSILSLFDEPELDFNSQYVEISSAKSSNITRFFYLRNPDKLMIVPPDKSLSFDREIDKFTLDQDSLLKLNKAALIMSVPDFVIESDSNERTIKTCFNRNKSSNVFTVKQENSGGSKYTVVLNNENLKLIPSDYNVTVGFLNDKSGVERGIVKFESLNGKLKYSVASEKV